MPFVTAHDLQELRDAVARGVLPLDFEAKLRQLAKGDLSQQFIEQNARTLFRLLLAAREGGFVGAGRDECEHLLEVLAYIRTDEDLIPDYRIDGFTDDQEVLREALAEHGTLLQEFKEWRLRNQVPALWGGGHLESSRISFRL